jgi:plastocyanin
MSPSSFSLLLLISTLSGTLAQYGAPASSSTTATKATSAAAAASASASNIHQVTVGKGGLVFTPDTINAVPGDTIEFTFAQAIHSVTRSSFSDPCQAVTTDAVWSGFPATSEMFALKVNDTNPIWLYCSQVSHCQSGMAMVVNPPYVIFPPRKFTFPPNQP